MWTRHHWAYNFIVRRKGPDGRRVPRWTQRPRARPGEGSAPSGSTVPGTHHAMTTSNRTPGWRCKVCYTSSKIRGRDNITIGTWNTRTLRSPGKLQELTNEMHRYRWNILGLCEMGWKNFGDTTTEEGRKVFFSGKEDKHEHGVGFLVYKDIVNTVMGCCPVSRRLLTICLRAVLFNITIVQAYAPISRGCLMSPPCLESQGCHLIPLCYLLSCSSA